MTAFVQAAPEAGSLILDLLAKAQNWPMSEDIAKRLRAVLPPKIVMMESMEKQGASPEQIDQFLTQQQQPPPDPKMVKVEQDGQLAMAKLQADQQQSMREFMLEMKKLNEQGQQAQEQCMKEIQKMILEAQTKIEVAQINAGVGLHKNVTDAVISAHDINTSAETARYQADNQPGVM
jgi:Fe2+ transport system protein B